MDVPGPLLFYTLAGHDRRPKPRDHRLLAESRQLFSATRQWGIHSKQCAICDEYGSDHTQLLTTLNAAGETPGPTRYLVIRNVFRASPESGDFVYLSAQDGFSLRFPQRTATVYRIDFSGSALLSGSRSVDWTAQGQYDAILGTAHLRILNSPDAWTAVLTFLGPQ